MPRKKKDMLYSYIRIEDIKKILKNSFKHLKEGSEVKYLNKKTGVMKMKKWTLLTMICTLLGACTQSNEKEIIFFVEMTNNEKSQTEIENFSKHYQNIVNTNEPKTLSWKFFDAGENKVIELSRWSDSEAIKTHIENISEGGILQKDFESFVDHYVIEKISVLGEVTEEVRVMLSNLGIPVTFSPLIAGYSK